MLNEIENETSNEGEVINETPEVVETPKEKKKFVFAKDRREAITAIVVMSIFLLNTAYMIGKYSNQQNSNLPDLQTPPVELLKNISPTKSINPK